ncbi:MAG: multicopper oxidase domain-containing protein [Bacteroidetes bacterium]|nr:multicopper oxidase domain-containing protein [Bacteroidota bacterium]
MNGGTYNIGMEESSQYLGLFDTNGNPVNTTTWGYSYNGNKMYLGPTFVTKKDIPVDVKWINNLGTAHHHLLPVDHTIHMAHPTNGVATVVHLHGGHVESASDGYPEAWFTQNWAETGAEFKKQTYHYSNDQEAGTLWYHDHALGITRLNVYAGLAGMYLLRDNNELSMNLPTGNYERELIVQDKQFSADGSMYFPALLSDPEAADFPTNPAIEPTIFPEFFGNYILVNGMVWPKLDVQPTKYRFRVLNASDSRFYIFKLSNNANFQQIGTEGGFLNSPVTLNQLVLAPGERADIVIDFSTMAGQSVTLENFGPDEPFMGLAAAQMPADPATTGQIMKFNVGTNATASFTIPNSLRQPIQYLGQETNTRQLLLLEGEDDFGRLQPSLGTAQAGALRWMDPTSENPVINETEIWEIYNNTGDAHPIHVHQQEFQLVNRQEFTGDLDPITSQLTNIQMLGAPIAPEPNEMGWKDTYIVPPGHVARYKVRFDLPGKFVWHCHILSHEDHDMMRPFEVMPAGGGGGGNGTPDCANVHISTSPGAINVSGLDGAPVTSLQVFTSNWQPVLNCFGDCGGATRTVSVGGGSFYVYVKYYDASYQQLCEVNQTVNVPTALTGVAGEVFKIYPNKYLEHAEITWIHNAGNLVNEYELERSLDGLSFQSFGTIASKGGTAAELYSNYDFEPAVGDNFYRIKLHLSNGSVAYSEMAKLHYDDLEDYALFPNPANNFVNINLEKAVGIEGVNIQVFNNLGVLMKRIDIDEVSSKYYQMDVRELHEGHYIVWVNVPGKRAVAKQLIIGRI